MKSSMPNFPGGSKSRVSRAGAAVRDGTAAPEDLRVIDEWRAAHRNVLNTFQALLRTRTRYQNVTVAQRHKRKNTIFDKLQRFPEMQLARMDDVAGCRLIFESVEELTDFRSKLHAARFRHKRRNEKDRYDYIKHPKTSGYRGIHDIYTYDVNSVQGRPLKGLLVELQYRTLVQHSWATAVEVVGFLTSNQPKFDRGDKRYIDAMALASELLARYYERLTGPFPKLSDVEVADRFRLLDQDLGLLRMLGRLRTSSAEETGQRNMILIFGEEGQLKLESFRDAPDALRKLFEIERTLPGIDVVLVRADSSEDVRLAFKNYFSDTKDFVEMVRESLAAYKPKRIRVRKGN
jgi:putative GTP pyrophosphokinase